jgi:hypothetical protein
MSKFGFDLNEYVAEDRDYTPIPKGDYELKCTDAEVKSTKSGGEMIAATFEVASGKFTGRKIWNNFNIHNSSDTAQRIGREQVAAWARAAGKPNANSFDELLERKFKAVVDIEVGKNGYSDKNKIVGYMSDAPAKATPKQTSIEDMEDDIPQATPKKEAKEGKKKNPWD